MFEISTCHLVLLRINFFLLKTVLLKLSTTTLVVVLRPCSYQDFEISKSNLHRYSFYVYIVKSYASVISK